MKDMKRRMIDYNRAIMVNKDDYDCGFWRNNYKVSLTAQGIKFIANANCSGDALDMVMDFCVDNGLVGLYSEASLGEDYMTAGNCGYCFTTHSIRVEREAR